MAVGGPPSRRGIALTDDDGAGSDESSSDDASSRHSEGSYSGYSVSPSTSSIQQTPELDSVARDEVIHQRRSLVGRAARFFGGSQYLRPHSASSSSSDISDASETLPDPSKEISQKVRRSAIRIYEARRKENRAMFKAWVDLSSPSSIGFNIFKSAAGIPPDKLSPVERTYLQEEMLRQIEPLINRADPCEAIMERMKQVVQTQTLSSQLMPAMDNWWKHQRGKAVSPLVLTYSFASVLDDPDNAMAKEVWAKVQENLPEVISQLRVQYYERLHTGTVAQQQRAYDQLKFELIRLKSKIAAQNEKLNITENSSAFARAMKEDLDALLIHLDDEKKLINIMHAQDYRLDSFYKEGARSVLEPAMALIRSPRYPKESKHAKAFKEFVETKYAELTQLSEAEIHPDIIADLRILENKCMELAEKVQLETVSRDKKKEKLKKVLKADIQSWRSTHGWTPLTMIVPVRHGIRTVGYVTTINPLEGIFGRPGGVPSTAQDVLDRPCNAMQHVLYQPDGKTRLDSCIRSAVPDPYMEADPEQRKKGARIRAEQEIIGGLLEQFDNDAEKLEAFCNTSENAAEIDVLIQSYLTTDKFRSKFHVHDDELNMHINACDAFESLIHEDGSPTRLSFRDKQGVKRTIFIKPRMAVTCCGANSIALSKAQHIARPWQVADGYNRHAVRTLTGSELPDADIGGWFGERLNRYESIYHRPHPNLEDIRSEIEEWRACVLLDEHHKADYDTFKVSNFPAHVFDLLRDDNPAVKADIASHPALEDNPTVEAGSQLNPVMIRFCKSGKDRTGAGLASMSRFTTEYDRMRLPTICEPSFCADRQFNAQACAMVLHPLVQLWNGAMGYKNDGDKHLLGKELHEARKYSRPPIATT